MKTSNAGIALIKQAEGIKLKAYQCPAGVWTIGHGTTRNVKPGMTITMQQAQDMLIEDVRTFERAVESAVKVPLNQNQFDALVSFVYNIGIGAFQKSTLLGYLNAGAYGAAAGQFGRWVKAGGVTLNGLVKRRAAEAQLFNTPVALGIMGAADPLQGLVELALGTAGRLAGFNPTTIDFIAPSVAERIAIGIRLLFAKFSSR